MQINRAIRQLDRAGVAAAHISDHVLNTRNNRTTTVKRTEFLVRIRSAVQARDVIAGGSDLVIIARTVCVRELGLKEAIARMLLAADAGADVLYVEDISTKDELQAIVSSLSPKPVLLNAISRCQGAPLTCDEAEHLGAKIMGEQFSSLFTKRVLNYCLCKYFLSCQR